VGDITGGGIEVFCLVPPGMCPGHFDMSPEQVRRLLHSRVLFRFDFQAGLDDKLRRTNTPIVSVQTQPGMCIPETYLMTCRQVLAGLSAHGIIEQADAQANLARLETDLAQMARQIRNQINHAGLSGAAVITSCHQAEFARWLGLDVAATFKSVDAMTPADIQTCLEAGRTKKASMVIANLQEGTDLPARMAEQLDCRLVVFSNFPASADPADRPFIHLLESNVDQLLRDDEP
jgi:ABC-type Zn uptake system ZnuABC Zn-binding protein ZnuA